MNEIVKITAISRGFQEDKDLAKTLRKDRILPALERGETVILDFSDVQYSTQSFIHALIGAALMQYGETVLDRIEFRKCSPQIQNLVSLVVDYTLGGFVSVPATERPLPTEGAIR